MDGEDREGRGGDLDGRTPKKSISVCIARCLPCNTSLTQSKERRPVNYCRCFKGRPQNHVTRQPVAIHAYLEPQTMNSKHQNHVFIGVALTVLCFSMPAALAEDMKGLFVSTSPIDSGRQMLLVIDPERQVLAVYHIETVSGEVSLRSTRALGYDLQLEDFNAEDPKPAAIKKMLRIDSAPKPLSDTIEIIPPSPQQIK